MKEIIIAAHNRNYLSWTSQLNSDIKSSVYRKGKNFNIDGEIYIENNVGRDVHTFFYHFVKNYDNIADYTFTSQDYFSDHVYNYVDIINGNEAIWDKYAKQSFQNGCWFFCTSFNVLTCDKFGSPQHDGLDIESAWKMFFKEKCPENIEFTPTGHFCVSKNHLHKRSLTFYKKILSFLEEEETAPWIIERLEPYIFNINYEVNG